MAMSRRDKDAAIGCAAIVAFVAAVAWLFVRAVRWVIS